MDVGRGGRHRLTGKHRGDLEGVGSFSKHARIIHEHVPAKLIHVKKSESGGHHATSTHGTRKPPSRALASVAICRMNAEKEDAEKELAENKPRFSIFSLVSRQSGDGACSSDFVGGVSRR